MSSTAQVNSFFAPTQISGCQLWLDAADTTTITGSSPITSWRDKSGTGRTLTFAGTNVYNSSTQSINTTNSPTAYFYANVNLKKSVVSNASVFIAYTWTGSSLSSTNQALWGQDVGGGWNRFQLLSFPSTTALAYGLSYTPSPPNVTSVSNLNTGTRLQYSARYAYQATNGTAAYVNGTLSSSEVTEAVSPSETSTTNTYFGTIDATFSGQVAFHEILIYTSSITTAQRQQVEGYLAWKWGLQGSLPSTHPYKSSAFPPFVVSVPPIVLQNPTATFSPRQISGCGLWLDAADSSSIAVSGSNVTQWTDKSGNGKNATQTNAAYRPTYGTSGTYNCVSFRSANTQHLIGTPLLTSLSYSLFFVFDTLTPNNLQFVFFDYKKGAGGTGQNFVQHPINTNTISAALLYAETPSTQKASSSATIGTARIQTAIVDSVSNVSDNFYVDGTKLTTSFTNGGVANIATDAIGYTLGAIRTGATATLSLTLNGNIYEVIAYLNEVSTAQRQQIEGYLAWKWGVAGSLPAGHPYKLGPPYSTVISAPSRSMILSSAWNPTQISGCSLWLDAADTSTVSVTGSNVTQWRDKSGNGTNMTQSTPANRPAYTLVNKKYMIDFIRANKTYLINTSVSPLFTNFTLYIVIQRKNVPSDTERLFVGIPVGYATDWNTTSGFAFSTPIELASNGSGTVFLDNTNLNVTFYSVVTRNNSGNVYKNGSGNSVISKNLGLTTNSIGILLGSGTNGGINTLSEQFNGYMGEVILYTSALTTAQQQNIEGYLAWKWGLVGSLPANHPFKNWPPPPS
jgi:hypothetical protein